MRIQSVFAALNVNIILVTANNHALCVNNFLVYVWRIHVKFVSKKFAFVAKNVS